jgi:hypothetical protein
MPTIKQLSLPDGNTYDLTAVNREVVPVITEYSGSETTFNALEITENEDQQTIYNINAPDGTALFTWTDDSTLDYPLTVSKGIKMTGKFSPRGGTYFPDSTSLPNQTAAASYNVMCIDSFSNGGQAKFCTATSSATANTIVTRQANGYIYSTAYNTSIGAENPASYTSYAGFIDSNGWVRKSSKANFTTWLGFKWSGQTTVPNWLWGGNANNDWAVYSPHVIAGLKYLGTASTTAKNFTINSYCTEIVITGAFTGDGILKLFTSSVPKNLLNTTAKEVWLGGGKGEQSGAAGGAARCLCNVTLVNSTTVQVKVTASNNGATSTTKATTLYVYQR